MGDKTTLSELLETAAKYYEDHEVLGEGTGATELPDPVDDDDLEEDEDDEDEDDDDFDLEDDGAVLSDEAFTFQKRDDDQRMIWGWGSISMERGQLVVDRQGDMVTTEELQKAAHQFVCDVRAAKAMHKGKNIGTIVDSMVFTKALKDALGIDPESELGQREGWFVGMRVDDDATWALVKNGTLRSFSFGGVGVRELVTEDDA